MPSIVRYARVFWPAVGLALSLAFMVWDVAHIAKLQLVYESVFARHDDPQFWSTHYVDPARVKAGFWTLALIADACFLMVAGFRVHAAWVDTELAQVVAERSEGWTGPGRVGPQPAFRRARTRSVAPVVPPSAAESAPSWVRADEDRDYAPVTVAGESETRAA